MSADEEIVRTKLPARYQNLTLLGEGGMGTVFRARDASLDCDVAIKIMKPAGDGVAVKRFLQEAKILSQLSHPHIVKIQSCGVDEDGSLYQVIELLEGLPLNERLKQGPLRLKEFVTIFEQAAKALEYAASAGIVHRDIKPANLFLTRAAGGEVCVKVLDFGIARVLNSDVKHTGTDMIVGSIAYMSPEAASGAPLDARSDVYGLGCVMFECLSGNPPYQGESAAEVLLQHVSAPIPELKGSDKELVDLVGRCLSKKAEDRPEYAEISRCLLLKVEQDQSLKFSVGKSGSPAKAVVPIFILVCLLGSLAVGVFGYFKRVEVQKSAPSLTADFSAPRDRVHENRWQNIDSKLDLLERELSGPANTETSETFGDVVSTLGNHSAKKQLRTLLDSEVRYRRLLSIIENSKSSRLLWKSKVCRDYAGGLVSRALKFCGPAERKKLAEQARYLCDQALTALDTAKSTLDLDSTPERANDYLYRGMADLALFDYATARRDIETGCSLITFDPSDSDTKKDLQAFVFRTTESIMPVQDDKSAVLRDKAMISLCTAEVALRYNSKTAAAGLDKAFRCLQSMPASDRKANSDLVLKLKKYYKKLIDIAHADKDETSAPSWERTLALLNAIT